MLNSVHWVLFSCLAIKEDISNVLELGTYNGLTTNFLSRVFHNAHIDTWDLPHSDEIFRNSYNRQDVKFRESFINDQKKNTQEDNITLILKNSFFLPNLTLQNYYDLVWVDAGHKFPDVAWDICNAYHATKVGGWIMLDDVMARIFAQEANDENSDSLKVTRYLESRLGFKCHYFLKRTDPKFSANPYTRKYVVLFQKN